MSALRLLQVAVAMLVSVAIGYGSRAPYSPPGNDTSVLRLSWRLRGEKEEKCRARTPEELAALPAHMRSPEICEGHLVAYRLTLRIDDAPPLVRVIVPAGARGDRPIFVMHDQPLAPGEHTIAIAFEPLDSDEDEDGEDEGEHDEDEDEEEDDDEEEHESAVPLAFQERVRVAPGQIVLITLSEDATTLVLKR